MKSCTCTACTGYTPVEEALPTVKGEYLCRASSYSREILYRTRVWDGERFGSACEFLFETVTHWAPIPKLPADSP